MSDTRDQDGLVQQLRESEERYRAVVSQAMEGIFLFDLVTLQTLEANTAFQNLLGYTSQETTQLTLYDLVAHDRQDIDQHLQQLVTQKQHHIATRRYRRKDSSLLDVEVQSSVIRFGGREVGCAVIRDITERKQAEQQLRWRTEDLALINTINEAINRGSSLLQVNQLLAQETQRIFSSNGTHLYLLNPNKQWLTMVGLGLPPKIARQIERLLGMPIPLVSLPVQALTLYRKSWSRNDPSAPMTLWSSRDSSLSMRLAFLCPAPSANRN